MFHFHSIPHENPLLLVFGQRITIPRDLKLHGRLIKLALSKVLQECLAMAEWLTVMISEMPLTP